MRLVLPLIALSLVNLAQPMKAARPRSRKRRSSSVLCRLTTRERACVLLASLTVSYLILTLGICLTVSRE